MLCSRVFFCLSASTVYLKSIAYYLSSIVYFLSILYEGYGIMNVGLWLCHMWFLQRVQGNGGNYEEVHLQNLWMDL